MFTEVSVKSVRSIIMASNSDQTLTCETCPLDPIATSLLKDCIDLLAPTITYLVNASFSCGVFPLTLKHGRITPVLKRKDNLILRFSRIIGQSPIYHFYPKF